MYNASSISSDNIAAFLLFSKSHFALFPIETLCPRWPLLTVQESYYSAISTIQVNTPCSWFLDSNPFILQYTWCMPIILELHSIHEPRISPLAALLTYANLFICSHHFYHFLSFFFSLNVTQNPLDVTQAILQPAVSSNRPIFSIIISISYRYSRQD